MKVKYKNVFQIQFKLWELVHPDVMLVISFESEKIEILMKHGFIREFISIDVSEWNNRLPDDDYKILQDLLIKTYQEIVIKLKYYNKI